MEVRVQSDCKSDGVQDVGLQFDDASTDCGCNPGFPQVPGSVGFCPHNHEGLTVSSASLSENTDSLLTAVTVSQALITLQFHC